MLKTLGHTLLASIFIIGGFDAFAQPGRRVKLVAASGIPEADQAVKLNGAAMVIAGAALALNIAPKAAATVLIGCMIPTTIVGHAFWQEPEVSGRKGQQVHFLKNVGLIGGLLLVLTEKSK